MTVGSGAEHLGWLRDALLELLRIPTGVPPGQTEVPPGDAAILAAVDGTVLPMIESLGPDEVRRSDAGDVAARFGPPGDDGLLVQTYVVSQHGNLMEDAHAGRVVEGSAYGLEGPCALGQGANQNKGPMAAALSAVRQLRNLSRPVWLTVNTEGQSSHGGSIRILDGLDVRASWGIVSIGTDLRVSLGNRGRVDVAVTVAGEPCHSSQPWLGSNPIERAADVVTALRTVPLPEAHPELGPASATPYQLVCHPVAPHTIPAQVRVVVDRRLLPGETVGAAVGALRAHLRTAVGDELAVDEGAWMLPAVVDGGAPLVDLLRRGVAATGREGAAFWSLNAFDAGYACAKGIPTVMFGPGRRSFARGLTAAEVVALDDCAAAAEALRRTALALCV